MVITCDTPLCVPKIRRIRMACLLTAWMERSRGVTSAQAAGVDFEDTWTQLQECVQMIEELRAGTAAVVQAESQQVTTSERRAMHIRDSLIPAMARTRAASDTLEAVIPEDLWTLPTYAQMLFQR